jgi:hypothetical protein
MLLIELEEALDDLLPPGYSIETNRKGELIIRTNCRKDDDGELISLDEDFNEDEDPSFDDDTVSLEDDSDDD